MTFYKFLTRLLLAFYFFIFTCFLIYAFTINKSNHVGFDIRIGALVFFTISFLQSFYLKRKVTSKSSQNFTPRVKISILGTGRKKKKIRSINEYPIGLFFKQKKICTKNRGAILENNLHYFILVVFLLTVIICDLFNIMIGYSLWIRRGQPQKYEMQFSPDWGENMDMKKSDIYIYKKK
jgi:hypothetical protein